MTPPAADAFAVRFLRVSVTVLVALTFLVAGAKKLLHPDVGVTMLARYTATPRTVAALGCVEVAVALWLLSFRFPRSAGGAAIVMLVAFSVLIGLELRRTQPLPCGCMPTFPGATDPHQVRRGLWMGLGRNGFLVLLAGTGMALSDGRGREPGEYRPRT